MSGRCWMGDEGFRVTKIVADGNQSQCVHKGECGPPTPGQFKRDDSAATRHLRPGEFKLRVVGPGRIQNAADIRFAVNIARNSFCPAASGFHTQTKRIK